MVTGKLQIEGEVIHVVVSACFNLNELMNPDFDGRNLGSMQKPMSQGYMPEEETGKKIKSSGEKVLQGELFPSRDFK
jgi:error-prone DNA polymerase